MGHHEGLRASAAGAAAARADAERASWSRLPTVTLTARATRTDEPMMAFGTRLDQGRIAPADFEGGRLVAGARAAGAMARAEEASHARYAVPVLYYVLARGGRADELQRAGSIEGAETTQPPATLEAADAPPGASIRPR